LENIHENTFKNIEKLAVETRSDVNYIQQLAADNAIILKGFPGKPDVQLVTKNLLKFYGLQETTVEEYYYVNYLRDSHSNNPTTHQRKPLHFVVIVFRNKTTKIEIFTKRSTSGPLLLSQLQPEMATVNNPTINCTNKLTKYNLEI
jgi:hypothetical protein